MRPRRNYAPVDAVAGLVLLIIAVAPVWVLAFGLPA